jgi:hypothetical protein
MSLGLTSSLQVNNFFAIEGSPLKAIFNPFSIRKGKVLEPLLQSEKLRNRLAEAS